MNEVHRSGDMPADHLATSACTVELAHGEALELATAWLDYTAVSHGIRSLTIKGDTLARFDLRSPRVSSDVDVLIEPAGFDDYQALLRQSGWEVFPSTFRARTSRRIR